MTIELLMKDRDLHIRESQTHASKLYSLTPLGITGLMGGAFAVFSTERLEQLNLPFLGLCISFLLIAIFMYYAAHFSLLRAHLGRLAIVDDRINRLLKEPILVSADRVLFGKTHALFDWPFYGVIYTLTAFPLLIASSLSLFVAWNNPGLLRVSAIVMIVFAAIVVIYVLLTFRRQGCLNMHQLYADEAARIGAALGETQSSMAVQPNNDAPTLTNVTPDLASAVLEARTTGLSPSDLHTSITSK